MPSTSLVPSAAMQGQIYRFVPHPSLVADLHPQLVEIDHRVASFQRPILPRDHRFPHRIGRCADDRHPRAYIAMIFSSKPSKRFCLLGINNGSKLPPRFGEPRSLSLRPPNSESWDRCNLLPLGELFHICSLSLRNLDLQCPVLGRGHQRERPQWSVHPIDSIQKYPHGE